MYLVINFLQKLHSIFTFSLFKQRHMQEPRSCLSNGVSCPCAGALCWIFQLIQVLVATSLHKYVSLCCLSFCHGHHVTKDTLFPKNTHSWQQLFGEFYRQCGGVWSKIECIECVSWGVSWWTWLCVVLLLTLALVDIVTFPRSYHHSSINAYTGLFWRCSDK